MKYLLLLTLVFSAYAMRDPFSYGLEGHRYACAGIGNIENKIFFAHIYKDGLLYVVRLHDKIADDEVVSVTSLSVTLKSEAGELHTMLLKNEEKTLQLIKVEGLGG